ncbi:pyrroloquinoline quinone biosynthesis protein PqqE [Pseudomonas syringae]|uniref:pyrroloquinoline quinone biosynthesis protein PqqE n=1 Tax=Pseudomonas syringae TaxID=317 RepID=UPI0010100BEF|nr:pyrroloquinoline quinone biosynthesis protein PqqE [Pseudomonas syringae]RXT81837.1 pyrroloquinoline quinone biosynthesis protein PqqE [Pseudomonas syringae]
MQITMNNTLYPGLSAMQVGQSRVDQAATQIASSNIEVSGRSQSSDFQLENLRSVDRSQRSDLPSNIVELEAGKDQFAAGLAAQKASNEMLAPLIDPYP